MTWRAAWFKRLDNNHAAAAAGTGHRECGRFGVIGSVTIDRLSFGPWYIEKFTAPGDVILAVAVGE